jgi:ATP-dependent RNA helicase DDX46/PRP5
MRFARVLGLRVVCAYGGAPIKEQIADLKRGAEIVICTPGRMIDLLIANSGRVTNLKRITYLVLDEADRMFDMGFGPQVLKIIGNIRPDKQAVLFSATFPRQMDLLARKVLVKPVEIVVGGISTVCGDVEQIVELVREEDKFLRLLSVLGEWYESKTERILIFVSRQDGADHLLRDLLKRGYPCMSLHGGKDQADRDSTIADFKAGNIPILVATSVAARGLDVKDLGLVINYECPNHMEDYVHRVGRTGRAGQKGTAYTFITHEQERFAPDIVKALKTSNVEIPLELAALSEGFLVKVRAGEAQSVGSGFGGKGLERIDEERTAFRKSQKRAFGEDEDEEQAEEDKSDPNASVSSDKRFSDASALGAGANNGSDASKRPTEQAELASRRTVPLGDSKRVPANAIKAVQQAAAQITAKLSASSNANGGGIAAAQDVLAAINARYRGASASATATAASALSTNPTPGSGVIYPLYEARATGDGTSSMTQTVRGYFCEIDINDYPQMTRWKITSKDTISSIIEYSETLVIVRGHYFPQGKQPQAGERRLHLRIEGTAEFSVERARSEIQRVLVEATVEAAERGSIDYSRYNL